MITGATVNTFQAIRVVANLSISPEAGAGLAANEALVDLLLQILGMLLNPYLNFEISKYLLYHFSYISFN